MLLSCASKMKCSTRVLSLSSLVVGLAAAGALSLAVATDFWLYTKEMVPLPVGPNDTVPQEMIPENMWPITMHSGLWRMCLYYEDVPEMPSQCTNIGYFSQDWTRVMETDTTNSILRAMRKSSPVIIFSLVLLVISLGISTVGSSKRNRNTIVGAVFYIFSALCLAIGVIFYISAVNDEVSHRKKNGSGSDDSFVYNYGWAFFFAGSSFLSSMVAAVTNISLHLRRYPNLEDMVMIIPGLDKHSMLDLAKSEEVDYDSGNQNPTIIL